MQRRPKLLEAIEVLKTSSVHNEDAQAAIADYNSLLSQGKEFLAARMVVDIVDQYYKILDLKGIAHA